MPLEGMGVSAAGRMGPKLKPPIIAGETLAERKLRKHREASQRYKLKMYPNRKVGSLRKGGVTKEFIVANCEIDKSKGCWNWKKSRAPWGYGLIGENKHCIRAHRKSYELWKGPIPKGLFVCHRCDNPPCCNPEHLFLGTDLDNKRDAIRKGRFPLGENRPNAKLTSVQVREIRVSSMRVVDLAEKFKVRVGTIYRVITGATYRSVV